MTSRTGAGIEILARAGPTGRAQMQNGKNDSASIAPTPLEKWGSSNSLQATQLDDPVRAAPDVPDEGSKVANEAGPLKEKEEVEPKVKEADVASDGSGIPAVPALSEPKKPEKAEAEPPDEFEMVYQLTELGNSADPPHFQCGFDVHKNLWWLQEIATGLKRYAHEHSSLNLPKVVVDSLSSCVPYNGDIPATTFTAFRMSVGNTPKPADDEEPDAKRLKKSEEGEMDAKAGTVNLLC